MKAAALRAAFVLAVVAISSSSALAGPRPPAICAWSPAAVAAGDVAELTATGLPDEWSLTWELHPTGVYGQPSTYFSAWTINEPRTAHFWQRGGGKSQGPKPGPQLNDYRIAAMCSVEVLP